MPDKLINGREPGFSEEDIQRGVPGKPSPGKMTPQVEKNAPKEPGTGHTK